jgi:sporulation protein YlmC with PRC-barrel domain
MQIINIIPTHQLVSYDVINPAGEDLGQVQDFMLDMKHGRIAFVVVAFGGVLGLNDKWFALPWEILDWSPNRKKFILNMPRETLEQAPGLDKRKWKQEIDLSWLATCYTHFGCAPYWEKPAATEEHIKALAYSIWEREGRPEGKDVEDFYQAEKILKNQEEKLPIYS